MRTLLRFGFMPSAVLAALGFLLAAPSMPAATRNWNTTDGVWETAGNWSPSGSPTNADNIVIYSNGTYTVSVTNSTADSFPLSMTVNGLILGDSAGDNMTLLVNFTNLTQALRSGTVAVGNGASRPTFRLENGTVVSGGLTVGGGAGGLGTLIVAGGSYIGNGVFNLANTANATGQVTLVGGSMLFTNTVADNYGIGDAGKGIFTVSNGVFRLTAPTGTGLRLGKQAGGDGELQIAGGTVELGMVLAVGYATGGTGLVNMAGGIFTVTNSAGNNTLTVGNAAGSKATLTQSGGLILGNRFYVNNGGVWQMSGGTNLSTDVQLGQSGTGAFTMNGGLMAVSNGVFTVGRAGGGTAFSDATISNGSLFAATFAVGGNSVGGNNGGVGRAWLYGGTVTLTNALTIGIGANNSTGAVLVANSGVLDIGGTTTLGGTSRIGTLTNQDGGTLRFTGLNNPTITVNSGSSIVTTNAVIEFMNAGAAQTNAFGKLGLQANNTLSLNNATNAVLPSYLFSNNLAFSTLRLIGAAPTWQSTNLLIGTGGSLSGSGRVQANAVTNAGTISPGNSPGTLSFSSNLTLLGSSVLSFEITGMNWSAYDHLVVDGTFTLGGTIFVTNLGGALAAGNTFDFWDAAATNGNFLSTNFWVLPDLGENLYWDTELFETQGILSVAAIPEPSAFLALAGGSVLLLALRRRR